MRRHPVILVLAGIVLAAPSRAGCPDPPSCDVAPCLVVCPAGDAIFHVTLRFFSHNPCAGMILALDFSGCPGFHLAPGNGAGTYYVDATGTTAYVYSNALGQADIAVRGGGGSGGMVTISTCDGVSSGVVEPGVGLGTRTLHCVDMNGDLAVTTDDRASVVALLGTAAGSADFNCSGSVTSADVDTVSAHLGHTLDAATPARTASWGKLKLLYR